MTAAEPTRDSPETPGLLEVGRVDRPHGVKGEVVVSLVTNRTERLAPGSQLHAGDAVLRVDRARAMQHRWVVAFAGVADRDAADLLRGAVLRAPPVAAVEGELWVHELIGAGVVCGEGLARGTVLAVEANPASDLLVLDSGALVPLTFVVDTGTAADGTAEVIVEAPPGIFERA